VAGGTLTPYLRFIGQQAEAHLTGLSHEDKAREAIYKYTYQGFTQNPLFGVGHGNFSITFSERGRVQVFYNPHQNLLGVACSFGFPALLLYVVFVLLTFRALWVRGDYFKTQKLLSGAYFFITACLWFVFLVQFRGLFHYTWIAKDLAFMTGAGIGVRLFLELRPQPVHVLGLKSRREHSYLPSSPGVQIGLPSQKA
jgi:O-antigen ligase